MLNGKIAIILLNYNDSRFLIDVVDRIASQRPDEFIIVDDRSTDRSNQLIYHLQQKYKIKHVFNNGTRGPFGTFIAGCQATDAEYVVCFSADDYPNLGYLRAMRSAVKDFPMVDLYQCNAVVIREGEMYERILFPFTAYVSTNYAVKIYKAGYGKNINLCGVLMKRKHVLKCWEEAATELNFDCLFSTYAAFDKGFVSIGECLVTYRSYPNSFGAAGSNKKIKEAIEIHKKFFLDNNPEAYRRAKESGIWGVKARWMALIALWGIMKLPKWARRMFYRWFYAYSQNVEKL